MTLSHRVFYALVGETLNAFITVLAETAAEGEPVRPLWNLPLRRRP